MFAIAGCLLSATSELPEIYMQNSSIVYGKGQNNELFGEKSTSGNSEFVF